MNDRDAVLQAVEHVFDACTGESVVPDLVDLILAQRRAAKIEALTEVREGVMDGRLRSRDDSVISALRWVEERIDAKIARLKEEQADNGKRNADG